MLLDYLSMPIYGIIAGLISSIPLGPIGVLCVQRTLSVSHRAGFVSGLGAALADTVFATLAIFALSYVTGFIDRYEIWVKAVGGLLVVMFGLTIFLKKVKRPSVGKTKNNDVTNFGTVLFLTLPNPAYFLFFVTIFTALGIGTISLDATQKWLVVGGVFIGATCWWLLLTWVVNKFRKRFSIRTLWWINKISGGVIMLLGVYTVLMVIYMLIDKLIQSGQL